MTFIISWVAKALLARGFKRSSALAGPLIWALLIAVVVGVVWWRYAALKSDIYDQARSEIVQELQKEQDKKLAELTAKVEKFNKDSQERADAMDNRQKTYVANTALILAEIKSGKQKVTTVDSKGNCVITPDAARTWNELQIRLQQSNQAPVTSAPTIGTAGTVPATKQSEAAKKWNELQKRLQPQP